MNINTTYNLYIEQREKRERISGIISTVLFHALLLLLLFFLGIYRPSPPLEEEKGIPVDFGTSATGGGDVQAETDKPLTQPASQPTPVPVQAQPVEHQEEATKADTKTTTQDVEEAPIAVKPEVKKTVNKPVVEAPKPVKKTAPTPPVQQAPTLAQGSLMGKPTGVNKPGSNGDDPGVVGDKGSLFGDKGNYYTGMNGTGTIPGGTGGGSGDYNLAGRRMMYKPKLVGDIQESGTVVISITVDKSGKVIDATCCSALGSTTTNQALINKALEDSKKIKFDANPNAPDQQFGTVTFKFKLQ